MNDKTPITVNGRTYPLWSQFVHGAPEWVGGTLEDHDMGSFASTRIKGIALKPNGEDSAYFEVIGEKFSCGFDVRFGGIVGGEKGWITFSGYAGHMWRIKKP